MKKAAVSDSWANLPEELLDQIFSFLPSFVDRASCAGVCSHWRSTAMQREHATPPRLPWLLRPSAAGASYFCPFSRTTTDVPAVPENARGARFLGSYPGGWFFVARGQWRGYALLNLLTGEETRLPDGVGGDGFSEELQLGIKSSALLILAAAVSPALTPDGQYLVAAITLGHHKAVLWLSGVTNWKPVEPPQQGNLNSLMWQSVTRLTNAELEDVIYMRYDHCEGFYFLTSQECLFVFSVKVVQGRMRGRFCFYEFPGHRMSSPPEAGQKVAGRYLVESDGRLLMVKRFSAPGQGTVSFQIFRLRCENNGRYWQRFVLIGQLLFIGRGSSRAFQTGKPNPGYIYFLDDAEGLHDSWSIIRTENQYRCSDAGRFSCSTSDVEKSWPQGSPPYSSPWVWLFH